ncbi:MAG TPA: hypothetical protein VFN67_36640 [Polyangiales bacterium]|nr:hypothetical protein [Polyangiales bacterium]
MAKTMSRELAALCTQLGQWRKNGGGGRGKRIPEAVWQQAAAVARVDGIHTTARVARLNYERLKTSMAAYDAARSAEPVEVLDGGAHRDDAALGRGKKQALAKPRAMQFVSVPMAPVAARRAMTIELISRSGDRVRIESTDALDVAVVVESFWSKQP